MGVSLKSVLVMTSAGVLMMSAAAGAQTPPPAGDHEHHQEVQQHDHAQHSGGMETFPAREASGTAWLPDNTPMYGVHRAAGSWQVMAHGNAFAQYLDEGGDRGSDQFGSINWVMVMARRNLAGGRFGLRGMASLEPFTIGGCGYPDLLATGERCDGDTIHDRQHPHDLFMELAVEYHRARVDGLTWEVYGGLAGEPALGPVAFPHRLSALSNPIAPISHHWLDATHITFGVVTAGVQGKRWKMEGSFFNGREPDEERADLDLDALDSYSGRVWWMPSPRLALQLSAGRLTEAEGEDENVDRITASATYHRPLGTTGGSVWASTLAWGRNVEAGEATHALLVESSLSLRDRDTFFGRFEVVGKPAHDLDIAGDDEVFTVAKLQGGYARYFPPLAGLQPGIGGGVAASFVPGALEAAYGGRVSAGVALFITVRPASHRM